MIELMVQEEVILVIILIIAKIKIRIIKIKIKKAVKMKPRKNKIPMISKVKLNRNINNIKFYIYIIYNCIINFVIKNKNLKHTFLFPFILNYLDIKRPDNGEGLIEFAFDIFILSLICLLCFINVIVYLIAIILLNKYNIVEKYPKLKMFINYYEKTTFFFVIFEGAMGFGFLLIIVISSFLMLGVPFLK